MVKSFEQAEAIQKRRSDAGKRGYAKAVRRAVSRFVSRESGDYRNAMSTLPVFWR